MSSVILSAVDTGNEYRYLIHPDVSKTVEVVDSPAVFEYIDGSEDPNPSMISDKVTHEEPDPELVVELIWGKEPPMIFDKRLKGPDGSRGAKRKQTPEEYQENILNEIKARFSQLDPKPEKELRAHGLEL